MPYINLDRAASYIKHIYESVCCTFCDKIGDVRVRYPCGHTACSDCGEEVPGCLLCLTPPEAGSRPVYDAPLTSKVQHILKLFQSFQETFGVDVIERARLSEKFKIEKEVFPECIQAPYTYYNKHKSNASCWSCYEGIDNRPSIIPGENISVSTPMKMDNSRVQEWLEQHEADLQMFQPRKPFADLSVNSPQAMRTPVKSSKGRSQKENSYTKRSQFKKNLALNAGIDKYMKTVSKGSSQRNSVKKIKRDFDEIENKCTKTQTLNKKHERDESGIEIDDDAIYIDDSQSILVDKDKEALLAVLKANENETISSTNIETDYQSTKCRLKTKKAPVKQISPSVLNWNTSARSPESRVMKSKKLNKHRIPFYKRSHIIETCKECISAENIPRKSIQNCKDVSVVLETNNLKTIITVKKQEMPKSAPIMKSTAIQTEPMDLEFEPIISLNSEVLFSADKPVVKETMLSANKPVPKETILRADEPVVKVTMLRTDKPTVKELSGGMVVIESGSDSEHELSGSVTVLAEVHKPMSEDHVAPGILTEAKQIQNRAPKPVKRGHTPHSSDSSDKENRDPNRKRPRKEKKNEKKKYKQKLSFINM